MLFTTSLKGKLCNYEDIVGCLILWVGLCNDKCQFLDYLHDTC